MISGCPAQVLVFGLEVVEISIEQILPDISTPFK
jgi:hypothetical protein